MAFTEFETLFKVLSAPRLRLLKVLRQAGHVSVRELFRRPDRDYKGMHSSVAMLEQAGLVKHVSEGRVSAPFDRSMAELDLVAA